MACLLWSFVHAASWLVLEPARPRAQTAAQQVIDDAASALGGRQRVLAVKTLRLEGGGHNFEIDQGLALGTTSVCSRTSVK